MFSHYSIIIKIADGREATEGERARAGAAMLCHGALPLDWVMETAADPSSEYFFVT